MQGIMLYAIIDCRDDGTADMNPGTSIETAAYEKEEQFFLPSFCDVRMVFAVVVIAELLAFVLVLVSPGLLGDPWSDLGLVSLFLQWIALASAAVLCLARPLLSRLDNIPAALISYLLVMLVTVAVSEAAYQLMLNSMAFAANSSDRHTDFVLRCLAVSAVITAVALRYLYVQFQWRQQLRAEARARIQALQARIRPHFLFNSMNTIASLIRTQPDNAEEAIQDLSDLFRASLGNSNEQNTLGEELVLARHYLNIEALRLGKRLSIEWDMEDIPPDVRVPPLVLQPLLENAIYHGIEPLTGGGTILVNGHSGNGMVVIEILNPVSGEAAPSRRSGLGIAQDNIRQRLMLAFGSRARLTVSRPEGYYRITLEFPEVRAT
jgi:two-component system sensor histidine kinase AlgZ